MAVSTLSKVENGQRSLSYDKLVQLANALAVDVSQLFASAERKPLPATFAGRRSVHRIGDGYEVSSKFHTATYLAHDLMRKRFTPLIMDIHARSIDEYDGLVRHEGDELVYVLEGEIELYTEIYAPLRLKAGESVFFDCGVGHAYVNVGKGVAKVMCVESDLDTIPDEPVKFYAPHEVPATRAEPAKSARRAGKFSTANS